MGTLPQAPCFSEKNGPQILEALNLWVRCRRRFFFFRKMAPRCLEAPDLRGRCRGRFFFFMFSETWPPYFWKPLTADYVAAGAFFSQKNGPHISASPELVGTLPQAPFFSRKMALIFLEAPNLWVRCRRRFFFSPENGPHISASPQLVGTLPQAFFFSPRESATRVGVGCGLTIKEVIFFWIALLAF